jgi:hypothetical protein
MQWADVLLGPIHLYLQATDRTLFYRWLYRRVIVTDGNMSAQHMKMRRPELDVALTDGNGYVVEDKPYRLHLSEAVEIKQVMWIMK